MLAQCPDCRKTYPVNKKQRRGKKAKVYCTGCKKKFTVDDALLRGPTELTVEANAEYLSAGQNDVLSKHTPRTGGNSFPADISVFLRNRLDDTDAIEPVEVRLSDEKLPWEIEKSVVSVNWRIAVVIGSLLLIAQILYFEVPKLSQHATYRPALEKVVRPFGFELPIYQNLLEFEVLEGSLNPDEGDTYLFKAVFSNQAAFKQRLPSIKLSLLDYNEQVFAERIFPPELYLPSTQRSDTLISPDETIQASLKIAPPQTRIGGFHFDLVY